MHLSATRFSAASATWVLRIVSVNNGRCGPCCSRLPVGMRQTASVPKSRTSCQVDSERTMRTRISGGGARRVRRVRWVRDARRGGRLGTQPDADENRLSSMDKLPEIIAACACFGLLVVVPLTMFLLRHQRQMAELIHGKNDSDTHQRLEALEREVRDLRIANTDRILREEEQRFIDQRLK